MYYLLDKEFNFIAPIEGYKSMIWVTRCYESGDFELQIAADVKWLNLFARNYFIVRDDDNYKQAMMIENIRLVTDVAEGNYIFVTGRDLKSILARRVYRNGNFNTNLELTIRNLVNLNCINSSYEVRNIPNLILGDLKNYDITIDTFDYNVGENLLEVIASLCRTGQLYFDILLDLDAKQFVFELSQSVDRSYNQTENPYVVFSEEFENLIRTETTFEYVDPYNALVSDGYYSNMTTEVSGLDRVEKFVDLNAYQPVVTKLNSEVWGDKILYELQYSKTHIDDAWTSAKNTIRPRTAKIVNAEIETNHTWIYRKDYFVGDIVEVINEYGIRSQPRITEVIESEDISGTTIVATLETDEDEVTLSGDDIIGEVIPEEETETEG